MVIQIRTADTEGQIQSSPEVQNLLMELKVLEVKDLWMEDNRLESDVFTHALAANADRTESLSNRHNKTEPMNRTITCYCPYYPHEQNTQQEKQWLWITSSH
jgi:hypothetical protein